MGDMEEIIEHKVEDQTCSIENYEARCWGCGLQLVLPYFAPVFKCGWCGAITVHRLQSSRRCFNYGGGVWAIFPITFPGLSFSFFIHSFIAAILSFNTLINYCLAVLIPAGHPPHIAWGRVDLVGKGSLDGHRYCDFCKSPKPPQAHHCRTCSACVVDMDHHCPFIGNRVGASNRQHFILFLFFTVLSTLYILLMSIYTGCIIWPHLLEIRHEQSYSAFIRLQTSSSFVSTLIKLFMSGHIFLSARAHTLAYLIVASLSVGIGVGLLLYQQLLSIYSGQTYLDSLQISHGIIQDLTVTGGWDNFRKVFGNSHFIFWMLPKPIRWHDAFGRKYHFK
ncbi:hypothetical protein O6H91_12G035600 [Diphasiastrum complanatum]|uniref:Uncharacterized protein n=1 Tax=Diphasiastrum complanatum TaxID=34168 RepID=A0ACC2C0E1_DIPCM|nr:hypothetical protein O6H91_12G035600 [Diphasiastrum complanatum]